MIKAIILRCWPRHIVQHIPEPAPRGEVIQCAEHWADRPGGDELLSDGGHPGGADGHLVIIKSPRAPAMTGQVIIRVVSHVHRRCLIRRGGHPHQHRVVLGQGVDHCGQHCPGKPLVTRLRNMARKYDLMK